MNSRATSQTPTRALPGRPAAKPAAAGATASPKPSEHSSRRSGRAKPERKERSATAGVGTFPLGRVRLPRPRLLPVTIFAAVLLLGFRVGDVWQAITTGRPMTAVAPSIAEPKVTAGLPPGGDTTASAAQANSPPPLQVAETPKAAPPPKAADGAKPAETAKSAEPSKTPEEQKFTPADVDLLQRLRERRESLDERERQLDQRDALLQVAEQRVEQKIGELSKLRGEIQALLNQVSAEQAAQLESLVKIYETMKPKEAANIFNEMDNKVLLNVISRMKETKAAPIIAAMSVKRAEELTRLLADRKKLPSLPE